jgi:hypothetical protein
VARPRRLAARAGPTAARSVVLADLPLPGHVSARTGADTDDMSAGPTTMDELLEHELSCTRHQFELLEEDEVVDLLVARFRLLCAHGWDWASALLLATAVETPAHEAGSLAHGGPARATATLVLQ